MAAANPITLQELRVIVERIEYTIPDPKYKGETPEIEKCLEMLRELDRIASTLESELERMTEGLD